MLYFTVKLYNYKIIQNLLTIQLCEIINFYCKSTKFHDKLIFSKGPTTRDRNLSGAFKYKNPLKIENSNNIDAKNQTYLQESSEIQHDIFLSSIFHYTDQNPPPAKNPCNCMSFTRPKTAKNNCSKKSKQTHKKAILKKRNIKTERERKFLPTNFCVCTTNIPLWTVNVTNIPVHWKQTRDL